MKFKRHHLLVIVSILLSLAAIISLYLEDSDVGNLFSGVSNIISISSLLFFIIISGEQLDESVKSRTMQSQPLPVFDEFIVHMDPPKAWFSPDTEKEELFVPQFHTRLDLDFTIKNIGNSPAVSIDVVSKLIIPTKDSQIEYSPVAEHVTYLKEDEISDKLGYIFPKHQNEMLESYVLELVRGLPIIDFSILYKNVLGGSFESNQKYRIWLNDEEKSHNIIKEWMKSIKTGPIEYLEIIEKIKAVDSFDAKKRYHDVIHKDYSTKIDPEKIEMNMEPISGSYSIKILSEEEYLEKTKNLKYPRRLGSIPKEE